MEITAPQAVQRTQENGFLAAFDAFVQAIRRARGAPAQAGSPALTLSQFGLLQGLSERDAARARELAQEAGVTASTATRILDALERRGVVERSRATEDGRGVTVTLTASGRTLLDHHTAWLRERQQAFFASLPPDERELAPDLMLRLAAFFDELAAGPAGD